jgi:SAM-dependent methyltransferase
MSEAAGGHLDPRTDRARLTQVAYRSGDRLADRQRFYRFIEPKPQPIMDWLYGLVGGAAALAEPIVDVGTGNGQYLSALPDRRRVGLDLSLGMLKGLIQAGISVPLVQADAQALPLASSSAGTILANHMLYHVPDISRAAREARRVLRPGGTFLAVTNGEGHLLELGTVVDQAVQDLCGAELRIDRSMERFTLENGGAILGATFTSVECHDRREQLVVPDVVPVTRYLASMAGLAPGLPSDVRFEDVLNAVGAAVDRVISEHGAFRIGVHAGAFVCR